MKVLVGPSNREKDLSGAFSVIVKTSLYICRGVMLISPAQAAVISGYQQPGPSWQQTSRQADRLLVDFVNTTLRSREEEQHTPDH